MVLIFADFYWPICWQVAAVVMQIVYKHSADFFGADRLKLNLISANNRQFESWANWTILTSGCVFEFVPLPHILHGFGSFDLFLLMANVCIPQYSFFVGQLQNSFDPFISQWHGII